MTQLNCTFLFRPSQGLSNLGSWSLWSSDLPLDEFFASARALPGSPPFVKGISSPYGCNSGTKPSR
jgi:hypothetical protein